MPLSEEELKLLEQMERALVQEDPKFVSALRGGTIARAVRYRAILGLIGFLVGVVVLLTGAMARLTLVGILGFLVMLISATLAVTAWRSRIADTRS